MQRTLSINRLFFRSLLACILLASISSVSLAQSQTVVGWLETVSVGTELDQVIIKAKIDSGADHSSLHATEIQQFSRQSQGWVKFKTVNNLTLTSPVIRYTQIKTKNGGSQERPVIRLQLCLNGEKRAVEVNLVNRQHFNRPMLIGRSALLNLLIDPQKTNLTSVKHCY